MSTTSDLIHRLDNVYGVFDGIKLCREAVTHITTLVEMIDDLDNALWKACGDDEQIVRDTVESQGGDYDAIRRLIE